MSAPSVSRAFPVIYLDRARLTIKAGDGATPRATRAALLRVAEALELSSEGEHWAVKVGVSAAGSSRT